MAEPLRIVIADDNYLVREGTRRLLEDSGQVTVLAAVGSALTTPSDAVTAWGWVASAATAGVAGATTAADCALCRVAM